MKKLLYTVLLCLFISTALHADEKNRPAISAGWTFSNVTNTDNIPFHYIDRNGVNSYYVKLAFNTKPGGRYEEYQEIMNFPVFGVGAGFDNFSAMQFKNNSRLGNFVNVYTFMEEAFYKNRYFSVGFNAELGVGFTDTVYDVYTNPLEINIGAPVSIYMKFGPQIKLRPSDRIELIVNGNWFHHSHSNLIMPNWGLNNIGIGAEVRYDIDRPHTEEITRLRKKHEFEKKLHYDVFTSFGLQASKPEFSAFNRSVEKPEDKKTDFPTRPRMGIGFDAMYRYCLFCSTGLAIDCNYTCDSDVLRNCDRMLYGQEAVDKGPGYSPFSLSAGFAHEFHYGNVSAYCGMSYYLFRKVGIKGDNGSFYQRAGMRFRFPRLRNLFLAWNVRATQFSNADFLEFQLGFRI